MRHRLWVLVLAGSLAISQLSCAVGTGLTPEPHSMPFARAALAPEYRVFYDALTDYGDWVLIEPYGYVFRPRVSFESWRPYGDGFWVPTDLYGWVWVSGEPFGWATYHYGQWLYDPYQGWVWMPGLDWGPSWVAWQTTSDGNYIGWTPLMPDRSRSNRIPGGAFTYVRAADLPATDLQQRTVSEAELGRETRQAEPIENVVQQDGVAFNRGPSIEAIERARGPLTRARIEDLVPVRTLPPPTTDPEETKRNATTPDQIATMRRAAEKVAGDARTLSQKPGTAPARLPLVRPFGVPSAADREKVKAVAPAVRKSKGAPPDSAR